MIFSILSSSAEVAETTAEVTLSTADILTRYAVYGAIILVGLIIIGIINRSSRPLSPSKIESKCGVVKKELEKIRSDIEEEKYSDIAGRRIKIYSTLNKMIYACTKIIDDEKDVTVEDVRASLQKVVAHLDDINRASGRKEALSASCMAAIEEMDKADKALAVISERKKKFGR